MGFRVAARTVLELGSELISSDAIAIYELVKNAFDAGSAFVRVDVKVVMRRSSYEKIIDSIKLERLKSVDDAFEEARSLVDDSADDDAISAFMNALSGADDLDGFRAALDGAYIQYNFIRVRDAGTGMSLSKLRTAFLTIGTANRITGARTRDDGQRMLGEKGVGRLSAMRLGTRLQVRSARARDSSWNMLDIDWDDFARDPGQMIEDVPVEVREGILKRRSDDHGTTLTIRNLTSDWSFKILREMAAAEFSRLVDPFRPSTETFPIELNFNQKPVETRRISSILFKNAHGYCKGRYRIESPQTEDGVQPSPHLTADFDYRLYNEHQHFDLGPSELRDAIGEDVPEGALVDLGPFTFEFYWYNRRMLTALDGIGQRQDVRNLVNAWSGGLMLFRDGFRVNPYGGPGDDWLDLNTQAFKSSGYLLNTDQLIGRVQITSDCNPKLVDQTNREGLRDTFEKQALIRVLHKFLTGYLKGWMDNTNEAYQGLKQIDLQGVEDNVQRYEKRVSSNVKELRALFPEQSHVLDRIVEAFSDTKLAFHRAKGAADKSEKDRQRLIELAGIGLMVEVVAHELARATKHTLDILKSAQRSVVPDSIRPVLDSLQAQLSTIERRLRVLDPLSVSGRQRKSEFDLTEVVQNSFEGRSDQLREMGIRWSIESIDGRSGSIWVKAVRGMIVQIVENLLSNSIHWLKQQNLANSRFQPEITVQLSHDHNGSFVFTDNGPGVAPQAAERVFDAFFTTRKDDGRGLGLYISRENARHFGGDLVLLQERRIHSDRLNSFHFMLSSTH